MARCLFDDCTVFADPTSLSKNATFTILENAFRRQSNLSFLSTDVFSELSLSNNSIGMGSSIEVKCGGIERDITIRGNEGEGLIYLHCFQNSGPSVSKSFLLVEDNHMTAISIAVDPINCKVSGNQGESLILILGSRLGKHLIVRSIEISDNRWEDLCTISMYNQKANFIHITRNRISHLDLTQLSSEALKLNVSENQLGQLRTVVSYDSKIDISKVLFIHIT